MKRLLLLLMLVGLTGCTTEFYEDTTRTPVPCHDYDIIIAGYDYYGNPVYKQVRCSHICYTYYNN